MTKTPHSIKIVVEPLRLSAPPLIKKGGIPSAYRHLPLKKEGFIERLVFNDLSLIKFLSCT